jgi:F-box-like
MAVEILPDDVLLEIFDFYVHEAQAFDGWHPLVHVCRRWRYIVFASPRRLNLRLYCTDRRPVRKMLDIWPALPIMISNLNDFDPESWVEGADNIIAALERKERICNIGLGDVPSWLLERFAAVMQGPFPSLTSLLLWSNNDTVPVLPDSFLNGRAPRLRSLQLDNTSFPMLRKLPLVASDLVDLRLWDIPESGYISPEAIVTCLAALTRLQGVELEFHSPRSRPNRARRRPPPLTRTVLPSLASFRFQGVSEYLEDFVARIDVPLLSGVAISFFNQLIFHNPQILQFIGRAENLKACNRATVIIDSFRIAVGLSPKTETANDPRLEISISCTQTDWQLSSLAQICNSSFPYSSHSLLECLVICEDRRWKPDWQDDMENTQWLELFQPFTAVKDLYLSKDVALHVAPFLQEIAKVSVANVLPALQNLFLEEPQTSGPIQEATGQFVASRRLNGHPVATHKWERGED